jgi:Family of unknown function (DUF6152)
MNDTDQCRIMNYYDYNSSPAERRGAALDDTKGDDARDRRAAGARNMLKRLIGLVSGLLVLPVAALAHHSFSAEFSRDLPVEVTGTVVRVAWTNPHARFYVEVTEEGGEAVTWDFELTTPNILMRQGWSSSSLKPGDTVTVMGFRARNDPLVANAASVKLANGRQLFNGSPEDRDN